jgi:hypothetical protein
MTMMTMMVQTTAHTDDYDPLLDSDSEEVTVVDD